MKSSIKKITKYAYSILVILAVLSLSGLNGAGLSRAGKQQGSSVLDPQLPKVNFPMADLPDKAGVNLFNLGNLNNSHQQALGVTAPTEADPARMFVYTTEDGLNVRFLILRTELDADQLAKLKADNEHKSAYKKRMQERLAGGKSGILTAFFVNHPAQSADQWTQIGSYVDSKGAYDFAPKFDFRVYPNGLAIFDIKGGKNILFGTGNKTTGQMMSGKDQIEIGGGKTESARQIARVNVK